MKKLQPGQLRFGVKKIGKLFRVYDWANGSFPYRTKELGEVKQDLSEADAKLEAERLNSKHVVAAPTVKEKKKRAPKTVEDYAPAPKEKQEDPTPLPDLPDYGIMSEEERAKYEEGLIEKVTY